MPTSTYGKQDLVYNEYLSSIDPLGASTRSASVRLALAGSTDPKFREFLDRLSHPRYKTYSLATVAKTCDISLPEFADFWRKAQNMRTLAIAQEGFADVTSDMVADARTRQVCCERCDGYGEVHQPDSTLPPRRCPVCLGVGTLPRPGDTDSRRILAEMTGNVKKGGSGGVQINNFVNAPGIESAVSKYDRVSFNIDDDVIDVDPIDPV